jgi:hypothetical protein
MMNNESNEQFFALLAKNSKVNERTGEVTVTLRGAAKLCGVAHPTLARMFSGSMDGFKTPETEAQYGVEGGSIGSSSLVDSLLAEGHNPYTFGQDGIPDTAITTMLFYYSIRAKVTNETARKHLELACKLGTRQLFHSAHNVMFLTEAQTMQVHLPGEVYQHKVRFTPEFYSAVCDLFGRDKMMKGYGGFIRKWVYEWFPVQVRDRIELLAEELTERSFCKHQLFQPEGELMIQLMQHIGRVTVLAKMSANPDEFAKNMVKFVPKIEMPKQLVPTKKQKGLAD